MVTPKPRGQLLFEQDFVAFSHIDNQYIDTKIQELTNVAAVPPEIGAIEAYDTAPALLRELDIVTWQLSQSPYGRYSGNLKATQVNAHARAEEVVIHFRQRNAREAVVFSYSELDGTVDWNAKLLVFSGERNCTKDSEEVGVKPILVGNETAVRALRALKMSIQNVKNDVICPVQEIA